MPETLIVPEPRPLLRPKRCETCSAWDPPARARVNGNEVAGTCRKSGDPQVQIVPVPDPKSGQVMPLTFSAWPPTKASDWCRDDWQPKDRAVM
jgi:hypothetical protein